MKIIVTGAAGFIGANVVRALNHRGERDIIAVDNLTRAEKFRNLADMAIADYFDKEEFLGLLQRGALPRADVVFHQGACSATTESDGRYMMRNNYRYSVELFEYCQKGATPLIYASSAAVYGLGPEFTEQASAERPLNVYGYSKLLFDNYVRERQAHLRAPAVGLRYFNVYGPREAHKGRMASVALHHFQQFRSEGRVKLFEASHGFANGDQRRDFIHIDDVVRGNLHFWQNPASGVYNLGTGQAQAFNDVALAVVNSLREANGNIPLTLAQAAEQGVIEYIPFPTDLHGKYQAFTQADTTRLRASGFKEPMLTVEQGVASYVRWLLKSA